VFSVWRLERKRKAAGTLPPPFYTMRPRDVRTIRVKILENDKAFRKIQLSDESARSFEFFMKKADIIFKILER
jgi:hypothetical protein